MVESVFPGMLDRSNGGLIFAAGLSSVRPMLPMLGQLALAITPSPLL
ncbi:hypothetical protein OG874_31460 [Nocardia sp. NBC_00565]|nr:hypothetical protein [Nocardia sp. NBC_00565]WUC01294.1 hypothetical protein OG874_31460 [Nocardia sp. NBC_00565]